MQSKTIEIDNVDGSTVIYLIQVESQQIQTPAGAFKTDKWMSLDNWWSVSSELHKFASDQLRKSPKTDITTIRYVDNHCLELDVSWKPTTTHLQAITELSKCHEFYVHAHVKILNVADLRKQIEELKKINKKAETVTVKLEKSPISVKDEAYEPAQSSHKISNYKATKKNAKRDQTIEYVPSSTNSVTDTLSYTYKPSSAAKLNKLSDPVEEEAYTPKPLDSSTSSLEASASNGQYIPSMKLTTQETYTPAEYKASPSAVKSENTSSKQAVPSRKLKLTRRERERFMKEGIDIGPQKSPRLDDNGKRKHRTKMQRDLFGGNSDDEVEMRN